MPVPDKRVTIDEIVAAVHDGMTVGIGGWGSRRKPMALVRALLPLAGARPHASSSYGGPDVGLLCRAGKVRQVVYSFVSLDSIALEPHFRNARQSGAVATIELDEGMFLLGLQAAAWRVPFLPTRVGLGSDVMRLNPTLRTVKSPYADGEELVAMPALDLDVALIHMHRGDQGGTGQYLNVDPYFDDLMCMAATRRFMTVEKIVDTDEFLARRPAAVDPHQPAHDRRRRRDTARRALHRVRSRLSARRGVPARVRRDRRSPTRRGTSSAPSTST